MAVFDNLSSGVYHFRTNGGKFLMAFKIHFK